MNDHPSYFVGVDLGQVADYTAIVVVEEPVYVQDEETRFMFNAPRVGWVSPAELNYAHVDMLKSGAHGSPPTPPTLEVRHLERTREVSYTTIAAHVASLMQRPPLADRGAVLVVDHTGVGRGVVDMLRERTPLIAATITGGTTVRQSRDEVHVPKRDLIASVGLLLEQRRLKIAEALPDARTLTEELATFRRRVTSAGHDSYEADWRTDAHDDMVLAVALAVWYREYADTHRPAPSMVFGPSGRMR
jgi:hypothetical protein